MPTWDRFDICEAFYAYAMQNHQGQFSRAYHIFGRLERMRFEPRLSVREHGYAGLTDNGQEIYDRLLERDY